MSFATDRMTLAKALHNLTLRASSVGFGLVCGLVVLATTIAAGLKTVYGINAGLIALLFNVGSLFIHHVVIQTARQRNDAIKS